MRLQLSPELEAFREEMRTFFTTEVPQEIRDTVAAHRHLSKDGLRPDRSRRSTPPGSPCRTGRWSGAARTGRRCSATSGARRCSWPACPSRCAFNASMIGPVIAAFGNQEQKERFLPKTANLDIWWCQGFSEPDAGSDLASLRTTAVRDGDDWVVNGQKTWTTLGQHADWIFCLVRTDPTAEKKQRGISMLVFPMDSPGVTLRPIELIDGGFEVNEVFFEDVRVPGREPDRRGEPRLGLRQVPARQRAGRHRPGRLDQADARPGQGARPRDQRRRPAPLARGPAHGRRIAELENELLALELTALRVVARLRPTASRTRRRRCSSCAAPSCSRRPPS